MYGHNVSTGWNWCPTMLCWNVSVVELYYVVLSSICIITWLYYHM